MSLSEKGMRDGKTTPPEVNNLSSPAAAGAGSPSHLPAAMCRWMEMWNTGAESQQSETARKRREQIMDAAESIIAHHGIARLSLKRIEKLAGMSRGQLLYYFPNKEAILLAVYERMIRRMIQERLAAEDLPRPFTGQAWQCLQRGLEEHLGLGREPLESKQELFSLLYTFLAQMAHREDYRQRLSAMYRSWREHIAADIASSVSEPHAVDPLILASIIQALIHGLTMQLMIDPEAFHRPAMLQACLQMLAPWYGPAAATRGVRTPTSPRRSEGKS